MLKINHFPPNDPNLIIILFVIHIDSLEVEKWRNQFTRPFLPTRPSLENSRLKSLRGILRHQTKFYGVNIFHLRNTFLCYYTHKTFQQCKNCLNHSPYGKVMPLESSPSYFDHHNSGGCHINPQYSSKMGQPHNHDEE